jgi:hypothetical protein
MTTGTLVTKTRSLDAAFYRELFTMEGGVLDSIKEKMPWLSTKTVKIQHDGAKPHSGHNNETVIANLGSTNGWRFQFKRQPAQSPDLNILDLGLFWSLKCRVRSIKQRAQNINELIINVTNAYDNYDHQTLDHVWACLFEIYNLFLQDNGGNRYGLPHNHIRNRQNNGSTFVNLTMDIDSYNRITIAINE